jgi:regulator of sirC expression with transglutaminase-like and TPR domain
MDKLVEGGPGIPITMALLYMELARRCDFPMVLHNPREG